MSRIRATGAAIAAASILSFVSDLPAQVPPGWSVVCAFHGGGATNPFFEYIHGQAPGVGIGRCTSFTNSVSAVSFAAAPSPLA